MNIKHKVLFVGLMTTGLLFIFSIINIVYGQNILPKATTSGSLIYLNNIPPQPPEDTWNFIEDLKAPMWTRHVWEVTHPSAGYADLSGGVCLKAGFIDPKKRLNTAYDDLRQFLAAGEISSNNGNYIIETKKVIGLSEEAFRLEVGQHSCRILATDIEGIRRGIFNIEDKMLSHHGAFLPLGTIEQRPFIRRRISRCSFGPIKRFPKMRDELMDNVDYYPDNYLNRLAHQGVNGLWLTVEFRDLCSTTFTPDAGKDKEKRLAKLRRTVEKCLRYGIRTYIFCIEPHAWNTDDPILKRYPELAGAPSGTQRSFCPSTETARQYIYESVNSIFKAVPELGGMINISLGERTTTCLSTLSVSENINEQSSIDCPRCSKKAPWEILHESISAMERGMHDAAPNAELMSWLYLPYPINGLALPHDLGDWVYEIPAHTPKGVVLQFNFESGVDRIEFGKELVGGDYWLSTPGPSSRFERIAETARMNQILVSAKIQSSTSHEVATVPYVPVPSLLYQKFAAMRRLGVTYSMLSWYFGNYPGLMNKAVCLLSFEPFPSEDNFLHELASIYWKKDDVWKVVEAWKIFSEGYQNYPLINMFQYLGPMHDGPVWPLLLKPLDKSLSPTWQIGSSTTLKPWPPSGDRIGESIGDALTLNETLELCRRMSEVWDSGVRILERLEPHYKDQRKRILDIGVAKALGIQFHSGYNILHFYALREKMLRMGGVDRLDILKQMTDIIRDELIQDAHLLVLCERDSRLGFHSEAEGYKYYPAKIRWRMRQLHNLLTKDVPELSKKIRENKLLFPEYTGKVPADPIAYCVPSYGFGTLWANLKLNLPANLVWQSCNYGGGKESGMRWASCYDADILYVIVSDSAAADKPLPISNVLVKIEPRRLWPCKHFVFTPEIQNHENNEVCVVNDSGRWSMVMCISLKSIGLDAYSLHPIRLDVRIKNKAGGTNAWRPDNPTENGWPLGPDNPIDLGWLLFRK